MTENLTQELARLNELDAKRTQGKWRCELDGTDFALIDTSNQLLAVVLRKINEIAELGTLRHGNSADGNFIAAAPQAIALANKLHALLAQAEGALATCRLFAGCEREYDAQLVEEAIEALRDAGIGGE